MAVVVQAKIEGVADVLRRLEELKRSARVKLVKAGVNDASKGLLRAVKAKCPVESGLLRKSLGRKVKVYRSSVVGLVGPRQGFRREVKIGATTQLRDPAKYAHLAERAKPFLRPAADTEAATVVRGVADALNEGIKEFG